MARLDTVAERPLSLRKGSSKDVRPDGSADRAGEWKDEKRAAAPVDDDDEEGAYPAGVECTADGEHFTRINDKSVIVLSTAELLPFEQDEVSPEMLVLAIQNMREQEDWLVQHEATVTLRRVIVHHTSVLDDHHVDAFLDHLILGCDNLRSALSKNSLLAFAECFEWLSTATQRDKFLTHGALLDVLLRRASCEKKFLRDAAAYAVQQMVTFLASWQLIKSAGAYAKTKNGRLCGNAARVVSSSLLRLQKHHQSKSFEHMLTLDDGKHMRQICQALAGFHGSKDKRARLEASAAFKVLGEELGQEKFEALLKSSLKDQLSANRIAKEIFPPKEPDASHNKGRRGSLRERILLEASS